MKVYIACPKTVPQDTLNDFVKLIRTWGADVSYWVRGTNYSANALREADVVVVLLPDLAWKMPLEQIPMGTRGEINLARNLKKPLYLGYIGKVAGRGVYRATIDYFSVGNPFTGVPGTHEELSMWIHDANKKSAKEVMDSAKAIADARMTVKYVVVDMGELVEKAYGGYDKRLLFKLK